MPAGTKLVTWLDRIETLEETVEQLRREVELLSAPSVQLMTRFAPQCSPDDQFSLDRLADDGNLLGD